MLTGAFTVGGFFLGLLGRKDEATLDKGRLLFMLGTGAAIVTGTIYLMTLGDSLLPFMRSSGIYSLTVGSFAAIAAVPLYLLHRWVLAGAGLGIGLLGMVHARHVLRDVRLGEHFDATALAVDPQWGVFALFVVCLLAALGAVAWMLRTFFRKDGDPTG